MYLGMDKSGIGDDLSGRLLIAMPGMGDPRFEQSVVYICAHSPEGSMGLIVNKPATGVEMDDLLDQLSIPRAGRSVGMGVHFGGPVEHGRGFVLHSAEYLCEGATMRVDDRFGMTATLDILRDMASGDGPARRILALGYAGWGPGQLEAEIQDNAWLVADAAHEIVFDLGDDEKWRAALGSIGVDPLLLSPDAGHA